MRGKSLVRASRRKKLRFRREDSYEGKFGGVNDARIVRRVTLEKCSVVLCIVVVRRELASDSAVRIQRAGGRLSRRRVLMGELRSGHGADSPRCRRAARGLVAETCGCESPLKRPADSSASRARPAARGIGSRLRRFHWAVPSRRNAATGH